MKRMVDPPPEDVNLGPMGRIVSFFALSAFALLGCERHDSDAREEHADLSGLAARDAGCPHMVDGSCTHGPQDTGAKQKTNVGDSVQSFGKPLGASPRVALADVLSEPAKYHAKKVRVAGHVTRACSRKGCWMELAVNEKKGAPRCRVTFENYGFFVPRDSAGSQARLEGTVQVTEVEKDAVQHYESEGATFSRKSKDGTAREVRLIATGVELERT